MDSTTAGRSDLHRLALDAFMAASNACMHRMIGDASQSAQREELCEQASLLIAVYVSASLRGAA